MLHLGDGDVQTLGLEVVAHLGHPAYLLHDPAGHGGRVAAALHLEQVVHIVQVGGAGDEIAAVGLLLEGLDDLVMLIPDLAHQLLYDVLQGGNTLGAAVLIHHHGHVGLVLLEDAQQLGDLGVSGGVKDRRFQIGQVRLAAIAGGIEVLLMDDADDVVNAVVINRQTGVAALHKQGGRLLHGCVVLHRYQVHPGSENLGHLQIVKLDGIADEIALVLVQTALVLRLVHHAHQFFFGNTVLSAVAEHQGQQALPLGKQEVKRSKEQYEHPQERGRKHGKGLRVFLGQALGGNLAENQDHDGEHRGGHRGTPHIVDELDKKHRADGGGHVVDDVVADEDGRQKLVIVLRQVQGALGSPVPVVRPVFQADAVERGKGRLGGGKIGGHHHKKNQGGNHAYTGTVHVGHINSTFSINFLRWLVMYYIIVFPGLQTAYPTDFPGFLPIFYQKTRCAYQHTAFSSVSYTIRLQTSWAYSAGSSRGSSASSRA